MITQNSHDRGYAVTLFSGLGSSSQALRSLGYEVLAHDFNKDAVASLRANGFNARQVDVREIDYSAPRFVDIDVLVGGPPCQPFSQAHAGDGEYDPRDMIPEFLRAIEELSPRLFVMEEVQTLLWKKNRAYADKVTEDMRALGYTVEVKVLDASDYGIGQKRKRAFWVGRRDGEPIVWLNKDDYKPVTMAEVLGWDAETCWERNQLAPEPARCERRGHLQPFTWPLDRASTTVVGSFRPEVQAAPGYRKAGDGPRQNTKGSVVTTLVERLALQGLPSDWEVRGSETAQALQVGNSVPMPLLRDLILANS